MTIRARPLPARFRKWLNAVKRLNLKWVYLRSTLIRSRDRLYCPMEELTGQAYIGGYIKQTRMDFEMSEEDTDTILGAADLPKPYTIIANNLRDEMIRVLKPKRRK